MPVRRPLVPALTALALGVAISLFLLRPAARELRGDEGTYVAMAASLARDFDLEFGPADRAWAEARPDVALILERTGSGAATRVAYSKPIVYPLFATPFAFFAGENGSALANLVALLAALVVAWRALRREAGDLELRDALLTFVATGLVVVYVPWRMTESLQVALALAGLATTFATIRRGGPGGTAELAGAACLGLLVSLREPNALVAAAPIFGALVARAPRRAFRIGATAAAAYLATIGLTWAMTGAPNPYKAPRSTFNAETGYPVGDGSETALARFDSSDDLATSTLGAVPAWNARRSLYAALYFAVGRHTGLLWYLPAVALFLLAAVRHADPPGRAALVAFAAFALFYLVWMPTNYFGGETFVGNRYVLAGAPLALVAFGGRRPGRSTLLVVWAIAAVVGLSALVSVARTRAIDATSQSHASAGLFRLLPYESTASNLDGRRDRYWAADFVRFVDPYADAGTWSFELAANAPAAELETATRFGEAPLHLLALADAPEVTLEISDWRHRERFRLAPHPGPNGEPGTTSGGPVRFTPAPAWRRHPFWWNETEIYAARMLRFRATTPDGSPATVRLRYLGRTPAPDDGFARDVVRVDPGIEPVAGGDSPVALEVVNRGSWTWTSDSPLPVQLALRLRSLDRPDEPPIEARWPLPRPVAPGETLVQSIGVLWPELPGRYRATLDLVLEDVAWFAEKVGEPLADAEIEVRPMTEEERLARAMHDAAHRPPP